MKIFIGIISFIAFFAVTIFSLLLATSFDTGCNEDHRSIALMRSLPQERLSALHARISDLSKGKSGEQLTNFREPFIPDDLAYLDALYISFSTADHTLVALTKCTPSIGISLLFEHPDTGNEFIELTWPAPTKDNPYKSESEILWNGQSLNPA